ncbi:hypothetical protein [Paraburkholderia sp. Tr-20389]|uniref:hypothetical protein n=1 Tax=Paraburkholderia sp. Tr-20389 TaxID=2703903 RepID=UPI00197EFE4B|nr:hypothetical protein [Paraburkholderia sp. Tr-20389]
MNAKLTGALLAACFSSFAMPVLAGGYDTASDVRTAGVIKASHAGQTAQTVSPHGGKRSEGSKTHGGVGGTDSGKSDSGRREQPDSIDPMYRGG